jgi:uncharacterized protein YqgV (UPF0045/DUF77 family)
MVVLEVSIFPLDKGGSVSPYVAKALEIIDSGGLDYHCHAMGTILQGKVASLEEKLGRTLK